MKHNQKIDWEKEFDTEFGKRWYRTGAIASGGRSVNPRKVKDFIKRHFKK